MSTDELIRYLRAYDAACNLSLQAYREEKVAASAVDNCKRPPKLESTSFFLYYIGFTIFFEIVFAIIALIWILFNAGGSFPWFVVAIGEWLGPISDIAILAAPIIALILAFPFSLVLSIPLAVSSLKSAKKNNRKMCAEHKSKQKAELPLLEERLKKAHEKSEATHQQVQILEKKNILHPDYLIHASLLADYLEKGRVDTLKEAINLLEHELREAERDRLQQLHYQEMHRHAAAQSAALQDIQAESGRAADAAEKAALWGAAATFIAASEAERQRKRDRD